MRFSKNVLNSFYLEINSKQHLSPLNKIIQPIPINNFETVSDI